MPISVIILAAGLSTRMNSNLPKTLHKIAEKPVLGYILDSCKKATIDKIILLTSADMKEVREFASSENKDIIHATQIKQLGTADAVKSALHLLDKTGTTIIMCGDTPFVSSETLEKLKAQTADITLIGFHEFSDNKYGRLITYNDDLLSIVEFNDANEQERQISHCNAGIYAIKNEHLHHLIPLIKNDNSKGEYYLTDIVKLAVFNELSCKIIDVTSEEVIGINTREDLALAEEIMQKRIKTTLMNQGVTIINPESSYIAYDFKAGRDVTLYPNIFIGKNVSVADNVTIHSFSHLEGANIKSNVSIGPFARIRPTTQINENSRIGNFVEIKNSRIDRVSKINHLSYIGDSEIGSKTNIGAGTITCNYDGISKKSKTIIGNNVAVGSNCSLVAPLNIADGAFVAAGSVITKNIEADDLAIGRARQVNLAKKALSLKNAE